jgi:hypothetical protein
MRFVLINTIRIEILSSKNKSDFYEVHSSKNGSGSCFCAAWWVPVWGGWGDRTSEENRALREDLFKKHYFDGYVLYLDDKPVGWCQVGLRDQFPKLLRSYALSPDPVAWAVTCFLLIPEARGKGLSSSFLSEVINDL